MWITTKSGKHINTDWFDKDRQIDANKAEADEKNKKADSWEGGHPWDDDLFESNAKKAGLEIKHDSVLNRDYVTLKNDTTFYHATHKSSVDKISKDGLKTQTKQGKQISGIYLSGGQHLNKWMGEDTRLFEVTVPAGTKLYQDVQPNAVFVQMNIPPERIKFIKG